MRNVTGIDQAIQKAKLDADAARLRQQFAQAVARGDAALRDRFGNAIQPGTKILWHTPVDMIWTVVDVKPVLDPRQQPGLVELVLTSDSARNFLPVNQPLVGMIVIAGPASPTAPIPEVEPPIEPPAETESTTETEPPSAATSEQIHDVIDPRD